MIKERIDEEDDRDLSDLDGGAGGDGTGSADETDKGVKKRQVVLKDGQPAKKRNFLQKTILDQTKELCFEHASLYKDFESVYSKILMRFQQWELFDDEEVSMACQSIKTLASSG